MPANISQKLKIIPGTTLLTINAPKNFEKALAPLPENVKIAKTAKSPDQVHWFVQNRQQLEQGLDKVLPLMETGIACWIYYPKGSSGVQTDLTRDKGWDKLSAHKAFHWISLVSFNETWSAFSCRLKKESGSGKEKKPAERPILQWIDAANKTVRLPKDFEKKLSESKTAQALFNQLSFTNRKEYVEWIVTAKRAETKKQRIDGAIERLEKGWKNPANR